MCTKKPSWVGPGANTIRRQILFFLKGQIAQVLFEDYGMLADCVSLPRNIQVVFESKSICQVLRTGHK